MPDISLSENIEQLLTFAGFLSYLVWQLVQKEKKIDVLEKQKAQYVDKYIDCLSASSTALQESTAVFERVVEAIKK